MANQPGSFIYMDHAATTAVHPEVLEAMLPYFSEEFYNPSSMYAPAQRCRQAVDAARKTIADLLGALPPEIIFTSGGTESDNAAIRGIATALRPQGNHIITSTAEHHAVLHTCHAMEKLGFAVTYLPVDRYGMVKAGDAEKAIKRETVLISLMLANNEVGTINPVAEIAAIAKAKAKSLKTHIAVHTDAVQCPGHLDITVDRLGVDALSLSSHKFNGPKGAGILYLRKATPFEPYQAGGSHERNRRAGTENVPGIVGTAAALKIAIEERSSNVEQTKALRDRLIGGIQKRIPGAHLNGHPVERLPSNVNFSFERTDSQWTLMALDEAGIGASTGSACRTASLEPSHVLVACGIPANLAIGTLRLTLGPENTAAEVDKVLAILPGIIQRVRDTAPPAEAKA
ncbi:MAG: aminotransferase class V-fold PLP-dependent enzyme [Chloroflexi bacterium]|nr:aminotransferase class V-fold PLP-dependent enzyme [Chloroflexota bacterium]